ncbi:hypothetical protein CROQUDRAFT_95792 [Cronartium quercuum f. sp. fusiforme G11]|uniref:Uncharacterized protein n=1 Tax=Cronartium quercuum f. sp. fusiforme G11 TaxID=708437 RepID=A0A9P6NGZ5_9BASI|nr:hypothetical protein CROQUDRAFT_95792 [Cronartium quercuum f. sp. fusiforme G11]
MRVARSRLWTTPGSAMPVPMNVIFATSGCDAPAGFNPSWIRNTMKPKVLRMDLESSVTN